MDWRSRGVRRPEGNKLCRKWKGNSKLQSDGAEVSRKGYESTFEPKSSLASRTNGMPMKMLIGKEPSKETAARRSPPCIIARLMGLDVQPTTELSHKLEAGSCFPKSTSAVRKNTIMQFVGQPNLSSASEQQESKDVFEVSEASRYNSSKNGLKYKLLDGQKMCPMCKHFIAEILSDSTNPTDVRIQGSRECKHTCKVRDFKRSFLSKIDTEPDFLSNSANLPKHITVLKSLNSKRLEDGETYRDSERSEKSYLNGSVKECICRDRSHLVTTKPIVRDSAPRLKLTNPVHERKQIACPIPTRIVVLRPSLDKVEMKDNVVSSFDFVGESRISFGKQDRSGRCNLVSEVKKSQMASNDASSPRKKFQCSSELWKENEEIARNNGKQDCLDFPLSKENKFHQSKSFYGNRSQCNLVDGVASISNHFEDGERRHDGSCYSTEFCLWREAIRHISKQWMLSNKVHKAQGNLIQSSRTLGDMLALSDRENFYNKYMEARCRENCSLATSSGVGLKKTDAGSMAGWSSCAESSFFQKKKKFVESNNGDEICPRDGESTMMKDIMDLSSRMLLKDGVSDKIEEKGCKDGAHSPEQWHENYEIKNKAFSAISHSSFSSSGSEVPSPVTEVMELVFNDDVLKLPENSDIAQSPGDEDICNKNTQVVTVVVASPKGGGGNSLSESHNMNAELISDLKVEQTSPISVLDPPDFEASPDCFRRVNADLTELSVQLQLLKSESESISTEVEESDVRSDEGNRDCGVHFQVDPQFSTDEEERDFSYVLGIFTDSGFQGVSMDTIFSACYSREVPVNPCIFEKLEKVFDEPEVWSRDERKLLFDLTNSTLSEFLAPNIDLHPWVWPGKVVGRIHSRKVFAEEVWKLLGRRRTATLTEPRQPLLDDDWMDFRAEVNTIGRDVERMIRDELLEELIFDLICR